MAELNPNLPPESSKSIEDIIQKLGDDTDLLAGTEIEDTEEKKLEKKPEEKEEKEIELREDDEEKEEIDLKDDDDVTGIHSSRKEILKKYPNIFKDFPSLERAYFKDEQMSEIFPTVKDAREASDKIKVFEEFEDQLVEGNTESLLKTVKDNDPAAFGKIVDNYLDVLGKVDPSARIHVYSQTAQRLIVAMVQEAQTSKNEDLQKAAVILNQFAFGSSNFVPIKGFSGDDKEDKKVNEGQTKLEEEKAAFIQEKYESNRDDLTTRVSNTIKSTIAAHIDPKSSMSDYVKRNAIRDAEDSLDDLIKSDSRFMSSIERLWESAFEQNFSRNSMDKIKNAFLAKAKSLLPDVIKKSRNDALKGLGKPESSDKSDKRGLLPKGGGNSRATEKETKKPERRMSTLEFLNQD